MGYGIPSFWSTEFREELYIRTIERFLPKFLHIYSKFTYNSNVTIILNTCDGICSIETAIHTTYKQSECVQHWCSASAHFYRNKRILERCFHSCFEHLFHKSSEAQFHQAGDWILIKNRLILACMSTVDTSRYAHISVLCYCKLLKISE